jgi:hypothetical protein
MSNMKNCIYAKCVQLYYKNILYTQYTNFLNENKIVLVTIVWYEIICKHFSIYQLRVINILKTRKCYYF